LTCSLPRARYGGIRCFSGSRLSPGRHLDAGIRFCLIEAYSLNSNVVEVGLMIFFGVLGYLMKKFTYDGAPLVLAMVLGPLLDNSLRQSLLMSGGSAMIFLTRPICLTVFSVIIVILILPVLKLWKRPEDRI